MASVQEMKDALEAQTAQSASIAEQALQAVDHITTSANFWLSALSIGVGVLGIIGVAVVYAGAKSAATRIAKRRIKSYLESKDGKLFVQAAIEDEVKRQIEARTMVLVHPDQGGNGNGFPIDPKQKGANA